MLQMLDDSRFILTPSAAEQVLSLLAVEKKTREVRALRVGVRGGGCSGLSYFMEFADAPEPKDRVFEQHGALVYIDPKSMLYLHGTELDFARSVQSSGFKWNNPNQKKACGCGESFSV